ncbi:Hypothetical predicted protein [Lecanosticta acicola]|uniref:Sas10 C-terminal domain-containing protein n=1 Tax=Lecanosticta acicola TaxID=111012 RepID=A0AAI8YUQ1_9PEZI|nr:Hypothetical predicted protein [Lecanosticta acicola]
MVKKRKAPKRALGEETDPELDSRESRKKIRTFEDVADSDDEFHRNQDEIRLGEEPEAKRRRKRAEQEEFLQPSDDEVLGYSEDEDQSDDEDDGERTVRNRVQAEDSDEADGERERADEEEDAVGWGTSKADLYGVDEIETEEQALEEEAEARRLQKKQLESMNTTDYGFDEDDWQQGELKPDAVQGGDAVVTEVLPQLQIAPDLGPAERLKLLKSRYPEFEPLSKDFLSLQERYASLQTVSGSSPSVQIKLRALAAYIGALAMYFSLLTSTASKDGQVATAMSAAQIRDHPVMDSLVKCRELWTNVQQLPEELAPETDDESDAEVADRSPQADVEEDLRNTQTKQTRAERHAEAVRAAAAERKAERMKRTEAEFADLDALLSQPVRKTSKSRGATATRAGDDDSDLGEEAPLTAQEAADKANRKKSLRFYTSQIAQKANKRSTAGRNAGGDDDIPYRERLRDRQARLNAEAEKRGKGRADIGAELGGDSDEEDRRQAQQIRADADEDDYYDLVAARAAKKKGGKASFAEAQRQAALQGGQVIQEESVGADGKRKISYAIEKNKGLTPHRKKDVRNPRVKKRKKYDEKKKKLASMKPVYKGGEGRGGYGGELTGIKKRLVKSTKL